MGWGLVTWCDRIHSELAGGLQVIFAQYWGWPDGCSVAMAIVSTGSNGAIGVFTGYGRMKSHLSTMLLLSSDILWLTSYVP
jgi:hypothetical protein